MRRATAWHDLCEWVSQAFSASRRVTNPPERMFLMTRNLFAAFASFVVAGTLVAAQDAPAQSPASREPSPQAAQQPADKSSASEMTVTGCLVQGSGPTPFILENAKSS